ncbi:hypothetical protein quinque_011624 [Culex quinquefasciatus]
MLREMSWLRKRCSPRQPVDSSQYYQQGPAYQNSPELLNEPVHVPTASHGCQEKNTNNDQQGQNRAGMLPTSFKYLRRVVNQSDSTLSIRQPTYTKRRNPARTELQANVARTGSIIVTDLGRRRRQRSTPPRASRRPVTNDTLMCKLQLYDDDEAST